MHGWGRLHESRWRENRFHGAGDGCECHLLRPGFREAYAAEAVARDGDAGGRSCGGDDVSSVCDRDAVEGDGAVGVWGASRGVGRDKGGGHDGR